MTTRNLVRSHNPKVRMRQCPTLSGDDRPLIAHSIPSGLCTDRQREFYHKCHRCVFRGKAADFRLPETNGRAPMESAAGAAEPTVIVPQAAEAPRPATASPGRGNEAAPVPEQALPDPTA